DGQHTITETQLVFTQGTYTFDSGSGTNCTFSGSTATATVASGTTATDATCIFNNKKTAEQAKPVLKTQATAAGVVGLPISEVAGPPPPSPEPSPDPTLTTVSCNPPTVQVNQPTTCTATVGSVIVGAPITTPTGAVSFFADASSTAFANCTLQATATTGVAR